MKQKAYIIDWVDSVTDGNWQPLHQNYGISLCQTIGYYVTEDKHSFTLALNRDTTGINAPYGSIITIPKVAIKHKRIIKI